MARKFETEYRVSKAAEILKSENNFRRDADLRLDALETAIAGIGESERVLLSRLLRVIETEISPRAAEIEALLTDYRSGVPAASVQEEASGRQFLTPDRRAAILADLRGGVDPAYQTLAAIVALIATKATPADITAAIDALKGGVSTAYDTLVEIAAKLTADDTALAGLLTSVGNRLRLDADQGATPAQKQQGLVNLGIWDASRGVFAKADRTSVAFTRTANATVSLKAGTVIELAGVIYTFAAATAVQMPTLTAGTDYAIYLCNDGTLRADASFTAATGFTATTSRQIGGFHYAPGGSATGYNTGGNTTPQINPRSLWDLKWRPKAPDPRGWTLNLDGICWISIYGLIVDHVASGPFRYNMAIADGASPPKIPAVLGGNGSTTYSDFTKYTANECLRAYGAELASVDELMLAAYGVVENSTIGSDPVNNIWDAPRTSMIGATGITGNMWTWTRDTSTRWDGTGGWAWRNLNGGRGQLYIGGDINLVTAIFGGNWGEPAANCGSRASFWNSSPWSSSGAVGARGRCDHLCHV